MKTTIRVDNLKCGGCANTVRKQLLTLPGIINVLVYPEKDEVEIEYNEHAEANQIKQKLRDLGYPESGTVAGMHKFTTGMRSYVSCAIGRISGENKLSEDDKSHTQR